MSDLKSFYVQQNKDLFWEVYRILYASEIDYHLTATFKYREDMENYTKGDYTCP